ncbi:hypothetical protein jhhlp_001640 [Lomentospora prolificans]|uniref:Uncharacterized protein n=1 Tax=Lomentospora prolificans TaxID=41688 RepID=A0A2N3NIS9_9PEZI|nr:hypothetical protein jhhlp_001640 [Lomentospora prolificans]
MSVLSERREELEKRFGSLVEDAYNVYLKSAEASQKDFNNPPITSANALLRLIRDQNEQFVNFRNRERRLIDVVGTLLKPIEVIGGIVAGGAEDVFPPSQHIFSAVMYLVGAAGDVSDMYDAILDLFVRLQDFTVRLEFYIKEEMSPQLREKVIQILAALFETLLIATEEVNRGRVKAYFRKVFGRESKVPEALAKLDSLTKGEEGLVMAETLASIKRTLSLQHRLAEEIDNLRAETREKTALSNRQMIKEILQPSVYPEDRYNLLKGSRTPSTGDWLVADASFKSWVAGEFPFLWICGNPGTGKSYLTSRLISWMEDLLSQTSEASADSIGYFFFRENNPETRSVNQCLRDIAYQLSEDDAFYGKQILRKLQSRDEIKTIPSAVRSLINTPCATDTRTRKIYLFLDGVDEAEKAEVEELLPLLTDLPEKYQTTKVQLALIGRNIMTETISIYLDEDASSQQLRTVHLTPELVAQDVRLYIIDEVRRSRVLRRTQPRFKEQVVEKMTKQVDGLFILARIMISDLNRKSHPRMILESLEEFPREINGTLYKMMEQLSATLSEAHAADLNEALIWVTCAEQTLTLEQLETILELKFGDPAVNLEETLRTQFSSFFTLDREDGLTTADLYQRHNDQNPGSGTSPRSASRSPARSRSPAGSRSPLNPWESPDFSSPAMVDFNSNKKTTTVQFFHASITEFLRDDISTNVKAKSGGPAIGFDLVEARIHVLKTCLRILLEPKSFQRNPENGPMWQYATWYWQEHLVSVDKSRVSRKDKQYIGRCLYMLLTRRKNMLDWTQEEESLKLFTDVNIDCLQRWMSDTEVLSGLDEESRDWAITAASKPGGLVQKIGRLYAHAWLDPEFGLYIPTMTCFQIVHSVAYIQDGHTWNDSDFQWSSIPPRVRMRRALTWSNIPKTAHSLRRVGSTYLNLGLHDEALKFFDEALPLDGDMVETCGRIAYCYMKNRQYDRALVKHLMCESLEERLIATGKFTTNRDKDFSRWRLYTNRLQIAKCYDKLGRVEDAIPYFQKAILNAYEPEKFEPEEAYLEVLAAHNRHELIMKLLDWMDDNPGKSVGGSRLTDFLVAQASGTSDSEWIIPKTACIRGRVETMISRYQIAIEATERAQDTSAQLNLRLSLASLKYFSRDYIGALAILDDISAIGGHPRGSVLVRTLYALSMRSRAQVYKQMIVTVGAKSPAAEPLLQKLEQLQNSHLTKNQVKELPQRLNGINVNDASLYLGLLYAQMGRTAESQKLLSTIIIESIAILNDDEPQNDSHALENLSRALVAIGDTENATALFQSMRRYADDSLGSASVSELGVNEPRLCDPFLPFSRPHPLMCLQCLNTLTTTERFYICTRSLDPFCETCLNTLIKVEKNTTVEGSPNLVCRIDHDWFSVEPLRTTLRRGEILIGSQVARIADWEEKIKKRWGNIGASA